MEGLYAGSDLHGNSNFLGIIDGQGKRVFKKKMPNELGLIRQTLEPFRGELVGIAVESRYNYLTGGILFSLARCLLMGDTVRLVKS